MSWNFNFGPNFPGSPAWNSYWEDFGEKMAEMGQSIADNVQQQVSHIPNGGFGNIIVGNPSGVSVISTNGANIISCNNNSSLTTNGFNFNCNNNNSSSCSSSSSGSTSVVSVNGYQITASNMSVSTSSQNGRLTIQFQMESFETYESTVGQNHIEIRVKDPNNPGFVKWATIHMPNNANSANFTFTRAGNTLLVTGP